MRLKLNRTLRAALIAAITAAGFTLSQAQAATVSATETWSIPKALTNVDGTALSLTSMSCTVSQMTSGDVNSKSIFAPNTNIGSDQGPWTLTFTITNKTDKAITLDSLLLDVSMYTSAGGPQTLQTVRTVDFKLKDGEIVLGDKDLIMQGVGDVAQPGRINGTDHDRPVLTFGGEGIELQASSSKTFTLTVSKGSSTDAEHVKGCYYGLIDMVAGYSYEVAGIPTWNGNGDHTTWSDPAAWTGSTPSAALPAVFNSNAPDQNVTIDIAAEASSVTVQDADYTFSLDTGASLTSDTLTITGEGASLSLTGTGTATFGTMSIGSGNTLTIAGNINMGTMTLTSSNSPAIQVADGGELTLSTASTVDGKAMVNGTSGEAGGSDAFTKIFKGKAVTVAEGGKLVLHGNVNFNDSGFGGGAVTSGVADLEITGNIQINTYGATTWDLLGNKLTVDGNLWLTNKQYLSTAGGTVEVKGTLQLGHDANGVEGNYRAALTATDDSHVTLRDIQLYGGHNEVNVNGSELTFTKADGNVLSQVKTTPTADADFNSVNFTDATLNAVDNDWTLQAISGTMVNLSGTTTLNVDTEKTLTLSGTTLDGTFAKVGDGTATVTISGSLTDTITVNEGTLVLSGTYAIDHVASGDITVSYIGTNGQPSEDGGFYKQSGTLTVYTVATEAGAVLNRTAATFTYGGADATLEDDGTFVIPGSGAPVFDTLFVKKNTLGFAEHQAYAQQHGGSITTVQLANNTTVNMDAEATIDLVLEDSASATVNVTADTTIGALTGTAVTFTGVSALTIGSSASAATLNGAGTLVINGPTVTINGTNNTSFTGNVDVQAGTLKLGESTGNKFVLGAYNYNTDRTITIRAGATLDLNGQADGNYVYTLDGGRLTNTGNGKDSNSSQTVGLKLTANSYVGGEGSKEFWLRQRSNAAGGDATTLALDTYTLTKQGDSTFGLFHTVVTGAGSLVVEGGTVKFNGGSIASNVVLNGGVIAGTLNMAGNISLTAKVTTDNNQAITVTGADKILTMTTEGEAALTLSQGLTVSSGTVTVNGNVTISGHSLDLSSNNNSTGRVKVGSSSTLNVTAGMWLGNNSNVGILLDEGGIVNIGGLSIVGAVDASIHAQATNVPYSTESADILIAGSTVNVTGTVTLGNTLNEVRVVVADGGVLTLSETAVPNSVYVEDGGTIAGGVDATEVKINGESTATFEQGVSDVRGVDIFGVTNDVTIRNNVSEAKAYGGLEDDCMTVTGDLLASEVSLEKGPVVVKNELFVKSIAHEGTGALTLANVNAETLEGVYAYDGVLTLQNTTAVSLTEMTIDPEATVAVYQAEVADATQEGTVTITETLTAGGGTLRANLTIADGDVEDGWNPVLDVNGGGDNALTLGSQFTIAEGTLVALDATTIEALERMEIGQTLDIIRALGGTELTYGEDGQGIYSGEWFDHFFERTEDVHGDYIVYATGESFGLTKVSKTPEPTTGTLSLLALCALAARRRRK